MEVQTSQSPNFNLQADTNTKRKLLLVDYILEYFTPVFNEEINRKSKHLETLDEDKSKLLDKVKKVSTGLKKLKSIKSFETINFNC